MACPITWGGHNDLLNIIINVLHSDLVFHTSSISLNAYQIHKSVSHSDIVMLCHHSFFVNSAAILSVFSSAITKSGYLRKITHRTSVFVTTDYHTDEIRPQLNWPWVVKCAPAMSYHIQTTQLKHHLPWNWRMSSLQAGHNLLSSKTVV